VALRFKGPLRVNALERSLMEIVRRHEVLRATFPAVDGNPVQIVRDERDVVLTKHVVLDESAPDRLERAIRSCEAQCRQPFDLVRGPLFRSALFHFSKIEYIFIITLHYLICDSFSIDLLLRELVALYRAFSEGSPSPLPDLTSQYADFAHE